ncbi:hypothetical protein BGZ80_006985 [Entomortierella chlamydospora]|uniref:F-box domain-containing protein n=1 Tax=Entomortierella chlamydospora TaxID=101097 RepID=A0A9P6MZV8_9FUNG|nr:hypothetical protein BGZ80_006985 [Entomortierella chlamydospora]
MMTQSPLDLSEIRYMIGFFLSSTDLISCTQVSRNWKASFEPLIWRSLWLCRRPLRRDDTLVLPSISAVEQNAYHVQHLTMSTNLCPAILPYLTVNFQHLRSIKVVCHNLKPSKSSTTVKINVNNNRYNYTKEQEEYEMLLWGVIPTLLRENPALNEVEIGSTSICSMPSSTLWNEHADSFFGNLGQRVTDSTKTLVGNSFNKKPLTLQRTAIGEMEIPTHYSTTTSPCFIKTLELFKLNALSRSTQLNVIRQCPFLQSLHWFPCHIENGADESESPLSIAVSFTASVRSKVWSHLNLLDAEWLCLSDEQWSCFLESISQGDLKQVYAKRSGFGKQAFASLMNLHKSSIRTLDLEACPGVTSRMLILVLRNCTYLEDLGADAIKVSDIEQLQEMEVKDTQGLWASAAPSKWACIGLKSLRVEFDMAPKSTFSPATVHASPECLNSQSSLLPPGSLSLQPSPCLTQNLRSQHYNQVVFRQISTLKQLETLYIREGIICSTRLQLRYCFEALHQLPELKHLVLGRDMQCFGKENIKEMLKAARSFQGLEEP